MAFRHLAACWSTLGIVALGLLTSATVVPVCALERRLGCPVADDAIATEACVRRELGIPLDAQRVAIVSQSSHLDWDSGHRFDEYFEGPLDDPFLFLLPGPVDGIFLDAVGLLERFHGSKTRYYHSVAAAHPDMAERLRAVGSDLRIVGGGITSPDSLLPPGESFIRDYLVGKTWVDATLVPTNAPLRVIVRTAAQRRFPFPPSARRGADDGARGTAAGKRPGTLDGESHTRRFGLLARRALTTIAIRDERPSSRSHHASDGIP